MSLKPSAPPEAAGRRPWWQFPWRYRESLAFGLGLAAVGFVLQMAAPLGRAPLAWPLNGILGLALLAAISSAVIFPKNKLVTWLASVPLSVTLMAGLGFLALIMGLTPQLAEPRPDPVWPDRLGLTRLTASWPFMLVYLATLVTLGLAVIRRWRRPGPKFGFLLTHLGLWLLLAAAGLGAADRQSYVLWVEEGEVEWRGRTPWGLVVELPLAIRLVDFDLEEYPPKLAVIDRRTGRPQPEPKGEWYQIDPGRPAAGRLLDWEITVERYHHRGLRGPGGVYGDSPRPEAAPAALVAARRPGDGLTRRGWVTDGGLAQPFEALDLAGDLTLVMASPEPKRFTSQVTVFTREGLERQALLEVNQPLSLGDWMIYQHSYDNRAGRLSRYSGLEAVYDPWRRGVQAGLLLMGLGALMMIWRGRPRA